MSYERDQFLGFVTSASLTTALAAYITSASVSSALATYVTNGSLTTALQPYLTSASANLGNYVTNGGLTTALAPYITSNSASVAIAARHPAFSVADEGVTLTSVAGTVTSVNFVGAGVSASQTGGVLTVTIPGGGVGGGEGSVSVSSMITTALATAKFPRLLSYQTFGGVNNFGFSGSWSDYAVLQIQASFRIETGTSATASVGVYSDGGTTPFLAFGSASVTLSANLVTSVDLKLYGGDGQQRKNLWLEAARGGNLRNTAVTATANTSFVNALKFFTSATMTAGMAALYGWPK